MKRILILAILGVLAVGGIVYLVVRPGAPESSTAQPADAADVAAAEAFDVEVDEIVAQETLDAELNDGTEPSDTLDDGTLSAEEEAFGSLDIDTVAR